MCQGVRLLALWSVVSVGRLLVRLAIDAAASAVGRCARGFAFGRCGPLCWRRKLLPAGYLSVFPAIDCAASRRVRSRLLGAGGSLDSEADAVIVGGIQWAGLRHVGGAPGSAARLPCWAGSLDRARDCLGACVPRESQSLSIAVFVGAVERLEPVNFSVYGG